MKTLVLGAACRGDIIDTRRLDRLAPLRSEHGRVAAGQDRPRASNQPVRARMSSMDCKSTGFTKCASKPAAADFCWSSGRP
jgi:hypothetical protein